MGIREEAVLIQEMQYVIENLVYHITEIMVSPLTLAELNLNGSITNCWFAKANSISFLSPYSISSDNSR